jgi:exonuclease III
MNINRKIRNITILQNKKKLNFFFPKKKIISNKKEEDEIVGTWKKAPQRKSSGILRRTRNKKAILGGPWNTVAREIGIGGLLELTEKRAAAAKTTTQKIETEKRMRSLQLNLVDTWRLFTVLAAISNSNSNTNN